VRACDNPFRVQRLGALAYRLAGTTWEELHARAERLGFRAAIVGPEGHGKSTLLAELGARIAAARGLALRSATLRRGERRLPAAGREPLLDGLSPRDLLLVDGAQELAPLAWGRLREASRAAAGLLVTTHGPGLLPTLHECGTSPALLAELVRELAPEAIEVLPAAEELHARHRGNLRDALLEAYDTMARLNAPSPRAT
jgi:hypothetical protein